MTNPISFPPRLRPHTPIRPLWICRSCAGPWPCPPARLLLKAEYDGRPTDLSVYLCAALFAAAADLYKLNPHDGPDPAVVFARFLGWARPRPLI